MHKDLYIYKTTKPSKILLNFECREQPTKDFSRIFSILRCWFVLSSVGDHKIFVVSSVFFNPIRHNLSKHDIFNEDPVKGSGEIQRYNESPLERGKKFRRSRTTSVFHPLLYNTQAEEIVNCAPAYCILRARNEIQEISFIKEVLFLIIF